MRRSPVRPWSMKRCSGSRFPAVAATCAAERAAAQRGVHRRSPGARRSRASTTPRCYLMAIFPLPGVPFGVPLLPRGLDRARAAERSWKVRAFAARRGTDLLAGRSRARGTKAGVRTFNGSVRTAGCGPRTLVPGRQRRRTRQHVPSGHGRRGSASIRPAGPAPGTRAESADTKLTARPAARGRPLGTAACPPFP